MSTRHTTIPLRPLECSVTGRAVVERALLEVPGVLVAYVNPVTEMAYVEFDPARCTAPDVAAAVARTGYRQDVEPVPRPPAPVRGVRPRLSARRFALAAGLLLAAGFALAALSDSWDLALAGDFQRWGMLLPGVEPWRWWSLPLGLAEAFLLGAVGGWLLLTLYRVVSRPTSSPPLSKRREAR